MNQSSRSRPQELSLRFAILGDAEPKPDPEFVYLSKAVDTINEMHSAEPFDFVAGVGDLPHSGKQEQYDALGDILPDLAPVFHPILGNEELNESLMRFFRNAQQWNDDPNDIPDIRYVTQYSGFCCVHATALWGGKYFTGAEIDWIVERLEAHEDMPAILFVHNSPRDIFPDARAELDEQFDRVLEQPNVELVFSGHSHMNIDDVPFYGQDDWGGHHVHVPALERTKIGDAHVSRFPVIEIGIDGEAVIDFYNLERDAFDTEHTLSLSLTPPDIK